MMDNARITPFRPPVISPGLPTEKFPQTEDKQEAVTETRGPEPRETAKSTAAQLNPLAALFDRGEQVSAAGQKFNQPADNLPVRGRFVDLLA